ncbi:MAG: LamG-like jellyroll fold domain-containing protein [Planctomycetota bacterium]|jgi:hypothetical protein
MARLFDDASNQYLEYSGAILSGSPLVMACWFNCNDATLPQSLMTIADFDANLYYMLQLRGDIALDRVQAQSRGAGFAAAQTSTGYTANTWHHACGLWPADNDRRVLIDNGSKGTDVVAQTPANLDTTIIGARVVNSARGTYMSGAIADAAIWDLSNWPGATASDKTNEFESVALPALANGYSPLFFMLGLVAYWPLIRDTDNDVVGGSDLTSGGGPTVAPHPGTSLYPAPQLIFAPAAAAAESASASPSVSPSPSPGGSGEVVWGHDTAVLEANIRNFSGNWTGTGQIFNPGVADIEYVRLQAGEYMISEIWDTGDQIVELLQNVYAVGDDVDLDYRHGATPAACVAAGWNNYVGKFVSLGYVQVRITSTL